MGHGEGSTMRNLIVCTAHLVRVINFRRLRWARHVAKKEEGRNAFKILIGKHIAKRPLGRPRHRWEDNIRIDLKEIGINTRNLFRIGITGESL